MNRFAILGNRTVLYRIVHKGKHMWKKSKDRESRKEEAIKRRGKKGGRRAKTLKGGRKKQ